MRSILAQDMIPLPLGTADILPMPHVSVMVPVSERAEPLVELYLEYAEPLRQAGISYEFLFLVEPWAREMAAPLNPLIAEGAPIRIFGAGHSVGENALLKLGAIEARGEIVVTLPSYRRVEAATLPKLIARVREGADLAIARRWPRVDSWVNRLQNRVFHSLLGGLARGRVHDVACGVRAMRRQVLQDLPVSGDFFRFLPLFALRDGYRVEELDAPQHPRDIGARVFSPGTYLRRMVDLLGLFFLIRFTDKPLRFFGMVGGALTAVGAVSLVVLFLQRLEGQGIADRPFLLLSVLLLVLGAQAIALGLIGEIIVHLHAPTRRPYRLLPLVSTSSSPGGDDRHESPGSTAAP